MCGVVEGATIKAEPGLTLHTDHQEPVLPLTVNTVPLSSITPVHNNSIKTVSTLCLPNGQPLTDANLLLPPACPASPGSSPPTISIQETEGGCHNLTVTSSSPPSAVSPLPYTVTLALPNNNSSLANPLSLSALLPLHPLPPTPLLPPPPSHTRSPLLSISEVTNTLLDHNQ